MSELDEAREHVYAVLEADLDHCRRDEDGDLAFRSGAAHMWVFVRSPWDAERAIVDIRTITNTEVDLTDELRAWVGDQGDSFVFGHVAYRRDPDDPELCRVTMSHHLLAQGVTDEALILATRAAAVSARRVSHAVKNTFGGDHLAPVPGGRLMPAERRYRCGYTKDGHDPHFIQVNMATGWQPVTIVRVDGDEITLRRDGGKEEGVRNHNTFTPAVPSRSSSRRVMRSSYSPGLKPCGMGFTVAGRACARGPVRACKAPHLGSRLSPHREGGASAPAARAQEFLP